jgi:hypothetical protein
MLRLECLLRQQQYCKPLSLKEFDITRVEMEVNPIHTENRHNMLFRTIPLPPMVPIGTIPSPPISLYVQVWYVQEKLLGVHIN